MGWQVPAPFADLTVSFNPAEYHATDNERGKLAQILANICHVEKTSVRALIFSATHLLCVRCWCSVIAAIVRCRSHRSDAQLESPTRHGRCLTPLLGAAVAFRLYWARHAPLSEVWQSPSCKKRKSLQTGLCATAFRKRVRGDQRCQSRVQSGCSEATRFGLAAQGNHCRQGLA